MARSSNESINNVGLGKRSAGVGVENNNLQSSSGLIRQPSNSTTAKSTQTTSTAFIDQNLFHNRMLINQYAIVDPKNIFTEKKEVLKKPPQNGARSSSGNWSEATSDLIQSSSSSSSPQLNKNIKINKIVETASKNYRIKHNIVSNANMKCNDNGFVEQGNHYHHMEKMANKLNQINGANANAGSQNGNNQSTNNNNEEAESVYSVDNDGYYTSMHTDSGLFFSNSLPFDHGHSIYGNNNQLLRHNYQNFNNPASMLLNKFTNNRTGTSTFNSQTSLAKRHSIMNAYNSATIDDRFLMGKGERFVSNYRNLLLSRLKRYPNIPNQNGQGNKVGFY